VNRQFITRLIAISLLVAGCGGAPKAAVETTPAPPPGPPTDPLGWMPEDVGVLARLDLDAWRRSPLAGVMDKLDSSGATWVEFDQIHAVYLGVQPGPGDEVSIIGVLEGDFGDGYLAGRATQIGATSEVRGETTLYSHEETIWFQVRAGTIVGGTPDRIDALVARQTGGPDAPVRRGALFTELAPEVDFENAHVALIARMEDEASRAVVDQASQQGGALGRALAKLQRGAARVQFDDGVAVQVVGIADAEASASRISKVANRQLDSWRRNPMLALFGLRDVVASISVRAEGVRVHGSAAVTQVQLEALIARFEPIIENILGQVGDPAGALQMSTTPTTPPAQP